MPHLPRYLHPLVFTMFAIYLLLSIYTFATYLKGANLCKSIFFIQCEVIMKLSSFDQKLYLCFELGKETIQKNIVVNIKMFFCR